jgi:hypothetical protein
MLFIKLEVVDKQQKGKNRMLCLPAFTKEEGEVI